MPSARRPRLILAALASCGVLMAVMQTIVVPLLPRLPALTGGTATDVSWLLTITLLTGAVFTPLLGRAGDMYGKRRVLLLALSSMIAGSVLCAVSSSLGVLMVGRGLQGAALAVVPLGISILRDELPRERVVPAIAMMSATLGVGAALGIPLATLVVEHADWHTLFWLCAVLGVLALTAVVLIVPESPLRTRGRFDVVGALGLSAFLVCLLVPVSKGSAWGWSSPATLGFFAAAVLIVPLWGFHQLRVHAPMVDLRVSARPAVLFTNLAALLVGFSFYANSLATAQLVQEPVATGYGLGASIVVSGLCLLPGGIAMVLLSPVSARLSAARGPRFTLAVATGVMAVGYAVRLFTSESLVAIVIGATVVAAGTAVAYSALPALIMHAVPVTETAAANGLNTLMRSIGQAVCSAVVATVLSSLVTVHGPTLGAYLVVFVIAGACALAALGLTLLIPAPRPAQVEARVLAGTAA
ncbi:MFS transporter [Allokutzneria sp. NRRL B-24872]|uniref:MFS transporter n=1 Tax=Allokutzneria sp. NRRL B-24872 TaxID=1137961 RepID=UPI000A3B81A6|nr:MFS transporter [Allokutzneria sp. NRRL B-24872]